MDGCGTALFCIAITALDSPFGWLQEISAGPSSPGRLLEHLATCQGWQPQHKLLFPHLAPQRSIVGVFGNNENTEKRKGILGKETGRN